MKSLHLENLTSPQVREAIENGYKTVIVVAGSIEQHGLHLPVGTDAFLGEGLAEHIAAGMGHTLVAPVIRPGCSDHHMDFAGTISIPSALLKELCKAYCRCLARHGFERIVLLSSHGGNNKSMIEVAPEIQAELPQCKVIWGDIFGIEESRAAQQKVFDTYGVSAEEGGHHAGFTEASQVLASPYGQYTDMPRAQRGFVGDDNAAIAAATDAEGRWNIASISPIGTLGDPTKASAEAGKAWNEAAVPFMVKRINELLEKP